MEKFCVDTYYNNNKALRKKVVWQAKGRRLSAENFEGENLDKSINICQVCQYFPPSKFCAIRYVAKLPTI